MMSTTWLRRSMAAILVLTVGANRAFAADGDAGVLALQERLVTVISDAERSVVSIARIVASDERPLPVDLDPFALVHGDQEDPGFLPSTFGSGVVVAKQRGGRERYVLTNSHVVTSAPHEGAADRIFVRLSTRHTVRAHVHAFDPETDLAVLRIDLIGTGLRPEDVPPLRFGDGGDVRKGELVIALGNPYAIARDGSCSASVGMISNIGRRPAPPPQGLSSTDRDVTLNHYGTLLHVDTRLRLGMSGGALVNLQGELIGVTTSLAAVRGYESSAGFAIPLDEGIRRTVESLLDGLEAEYGFLGIAPDDALSRDLIAARPVVRQATAARIGRVAADSPADRSGLRAGDVVLRVDGRPVYDGNDLLREVAFLGPGHEATLRIWRPGSGRLRTVMVRLAKRPLYDDSRLVTSVDRYPAWRGLRVDWPTGRHRFMPSVFLETYERAVAASEILPESIAEEAGLQPGELIAKVGGKAVETPSEFYAAVDGLDGEVVSLTTVGGRVLDMPPSGK